MIEAIVWISCAALLFIGAVYLLWRWFFGRFVNRESDAEAQRVGGGAGGPVEPASGGRDKAA
jgi:hypothetical protein